jgi:putative phage-type endonuclease
MIYEVIKGLVGISREEWLDLRSVGIGGSDVASIYGESPWTSAYSLWAQKSGRVEREADSGNEATDWGNRLERVVAEKFAHDYEAAVVEWPVMLRSKAHSFMLANLDFLIVEPSEKFPAGAITNWAGNKMPPNVINILEIKTTGIATKGAGHKWANEHVPLNYELQGMHYSAVTGIEGVVFAALIGGEGLVVRGRLYGDGERAELVEKEAEFWHKVQNDIEPEPDGSENTFDTIAKIYPKHEEGVTVEGDDFVAATYQEYLAAKKTSEEAEEKARALRAKLELAIGDGEALQYNGEVLYTFKANKDGEAFDTKAFKAAHPDIASQFTKVRKGYRVLRLKGE